MGTPVQGTDDGTAGYGVQGVSSSAVGVEGCIEALTFKRTPSGALLPGPPVPPPKPPLATGVYGSNRSGPAITGLGGAGSGHTPKDKTIGAVWGDSDKGNGVYGSSTGFNGIQGESWAAAHAGVAGVNNSGGPGVWGSSTGNAGQFEGNVLVSETLSVGADISIQGNILNVNTITCVGDVLLTGADCAEHFDILDECRLRPGTVVVIGTDGALRESCGAYDRKVAGIVSGAGSYRPAIVLDRQSVEANGRLPIALVGKVFCQIDAGYGAVEVGDLLTTSPTPGHAMKASDPARAFGAVIGKALRPLAEGCALVPVLVALQ